MVLGHESSRIELFVETHVRSNDRKKRYNGSLRPSLALCGMLVFNHFFLKLLFP